VADFLSGPKAAAPPAAKTIAPIPAKAAPPGKPPTKTAPALAATPSVTGNFVVQIAAVSSQETADILLATLKSKGYNVVSRRIPQDNFMHIQVGPFANRKDAEAMRDRISADGFNAIIKP
jgi:cell division septation protein DedD